MCKNLLPNDHSDSPLTLSANQVPEDEDLLKLFEAYRYESHEDFVMETAETFNIEIRGKDEHFFVKTGM